MVVAHVQIWFHLNPDEDGYPPQTEEPVWAEASSAGYILHGVPFYAREANVGDLVEAVERGERLWYVRTRHSAHNSLIRVLLSPGTQAEPVVDRLRALGCVLQRSGKGALLAVAVPPRKNVLRTVQTYLGELQREGFVGYEEPMLWDW